MKKLIVMSLCALLALASCSKKRKGDPKVLVFSKTMGFKHASIPAGIAAIQKLGKENSFEVDTTTNAALFTDDNLKQYSTVIFLNTTGNVLDYKEEAAFERYIQSGGGFMGIHAATDTEYDWGWYGKLVGGYFVSHPHGTPEADYIIKDKSVPATSFFTEDVWHRADEIYNFKNLNPDVKVLVTVDEKTYEGGINGDYHPITWFHEFDGGRAFYTAMGHTDESYEDEKYLKHILAGIEYAIGENEELDYAKATTQIPPDADRFTKVTLSTGEFFEPTEMTILPNNDLLIAERRGGIKLFKDSTKELTEVAHLDVYHKTLQTPGVNAEEGVMGLQKDPNYATNHWIYVYYAPTGDKWINRLSRFKYEDGVFDTASEQVILEIDSQREICCHTGGSIAFGPDNMLYLSTGDNSTPFNESDVAYVNNGFAPTNDIPGHEQFDARRTSGNTNDLRGKILRIIVNEDGSYDIPKGNLFPEGTAKTRPEIFTMGHRNPYRISVDPKQGWVYWGDVGPDSRVDSLETRGPRGYDEMNQAREAGNYGWPLFIADNKPYVAYNYETGESGAAYDPEKPINNSRNNTGLTELPKAQPAYIYYHYGESQEFPEVGSGGRNAMAGPVFYKDIYPNAKSLPEYYDGKVIIYDWMRGWMKALTLFPNGEVNKAEPFASGIKLNNLIDMEISSEGRIYLLEYGSGWFTQNENSGLSYIDYNGGNRPPLVDNISVDKTSGKVPLNVVATVEARDRENDPITYTWDLGDGTTKETTEPTLSYTYDKVGDYKIGVEVKDDKGASIKSSTVSVVAGNSRPEVNIEISGGNESFFIAGVPVSYKVSVTDADEATIDESNIYVSVDYLESLDKVEMNMGHQQVSAAVTGKALTQSLDCKTCHKEAEASIGPNYMDVAKKYQNDENAVSYLQKKIISGGSGVWGEVTMPAHPKLSTDEARQIALYITSLTGTVNEKPSLPAAGTITPEAAEGNNVMVITASYTDAGANGAKPLTGSKSVALKSNTVSFSESTKKSDSFQSMSFNGMNLLIVSPDGGWFAVEDIDLTGVSQVLLFAGWQAPPAGSVDFEARLGSPDGEVVGKGTLAKAMATPEGGAIPVVFSKEITGKKDIYFVYVPNPENSESTVALTSATFK